MWLWEVLGSLCMFPVCLALGPKLAESAVRKRRCDGECKNKLLPVKMVCFLLASVLVSHCLTSSNLDAAATSESWCTSHEVACNWLRLQRSWRRWTNSSWRSCKPCCFPKDIEQQLELWAQVLPHANEVTSPDLALTYLNMANAATASLPPSKALAEFSVP